MRAFVSRYRSGILDILSQGPCQSQMSVVPGGKSSVTLLGGPAAPAQRVMPDVGSESASIGGVLDRVGMSGIEVPIRAPGQSGGAAIFGRADAYVDLVDPDAKGIHMSRLYRQLMAELQATELSMALLQKLLRGFVESHVGISRLAQVRLAFELPIERPSLRSGNFGWRAYPVEVDAVLDDGGLRVWLTVSVTYSSTCPCSAALARQLIQERFLADFAGRGGVSTDEVAAWLLRPESICATPHSQRSVARIRLELDPSAECLSPAAFIDQAEGALRTPVQAHVRREDEQEFALLNGQNNMFCEDSGRRLKQAFEGASGVLDFSIEVRHLESLHPHDAVSFASKDLRSGRLTLSRL
ncbi:unnamed protein product [Prorocentrum cordatum]|uniref:GTP cyclohydrolase I n=1 Tax=Prorocentrum cordatum TaxID=2364126 RepID=A0ABN9WCK7_9DINO|nr:unnamed protein product [Polarella glacialis]